MLRQLLFLFEQGGPRGIIEAYLKFTDLTGFDYLSEEERINYTLDHVENVLPGIRKYFEGGVTKC